MKDCNSCHLILLCIIQLHVSTSLIINDSSTESATFSSLPTTVSPETTTLSFLTTSTTSSPPSIQQSSLGMKCDFRTFKQGCPDPQTTVCDKKTKECICKNGIAVLIQGRCMSFKNVDEPCYSSKECDLIGAKCINAFGEVDAFDTLVSRPFTRNIDSNPTSTGGSSTENKEASSGLLPSSVNTFFNLYGGFCQCPSGFYHSQEKNKCQRRLIGVRCRNETDCFSKQHVVCDQIERRCLCNHGFSLDLMSDQCKPAVGMSGPSPDSRYLSPRATPICEYGLIWDSSIRKCVPLTYWENNRTWSGLVWKVVVLCVVLVLLMMLASGIQKARQNENLLNWGRAFELYAARNAAGNDPDSVIPPVSTLSSHSTTFDGISRMLPRSSHRTTGLMLVMPPPPQYSASAMEGSNVTPRSLRREAPPSYEEAIRQSCSSTTTVMTVTSTTPRSDSNETTATSQSERSQQIMPSIIVSRQPDVKLDN